MQGLHEELFTQITNALIVADLLTLEAHLPGLIDAALQEIAEDLAAFAKRDPAAQGRLDLIMQNRTSFKAVMLYRLAHRIWHLPPCEGHDYRLVAERLSLQGRLISGAYIHPAARIGRRFVLDHGYGIAIGPTCGIGNDCYISCAVTLGTPQMSDDLCLPPDQCRPQLGNNVEVGAGAKLTGYVKIDDNVIIGPACAITHTLPGDAWVKVVNWTGSSS